MKKTLLSLGVSALFGLTSISASAGLINVGGVVWDPEASTAFPSEIDFTSHGTVLENAALWPVSTHVAGRGLITQLNSTLPNGSSFCPGCELTYTFSMDLTSVTAVFGNISLFQFSNLAVNVFVDHSADYDGSSARAGDGVLWLSMTSNGVLNGSGTDIGSGSDRGAGDALLDVVGGLAMANFDTNLELNGADMVFSSSFQPAGFPEGGIPMLTGTVDITGNSIPEPESLALVGLGLLGLAASRRRKQA